MKNKSIALAIATSIFLFTGCATTGSQVSTIQDNRDCIQKSEISSIAFQSLQKIKNDGAELKSLTSELNEYAKWLSVYFSGYSKYIEQAGTYSPLIKMIPLPYAGQAGDIVKFGSKLTLSITNSAVALDNANRSITKYEELLRDANSPAKIALAAKFADEKLIPDLKDAQQKNETLQNMSLSLLAFGESVEKATNGAQDALLKAKSIFSSDASEKDRQPKSAQIKQKLDLMKVKMARIDDIIKNSSVSAKKAYVYSELISN